MIKAFYIRKPVQTTAILQQLPNRDDMTGQKDVVGGAVRPRLYFHLVRRDDLHSGDSY